MKTLLIERTAALPADAARVRAALTDATLRARLAPAAWVDRVTMDGPERLHVRVASSAGTRELEFTVEEPDPGFEIVETDANVGVVRSYRLEPFAYGAATRLTSRLELRLAEDDGELEFALRSIQQAELERLAEFAGRVALAKSPVTRLDAGMRRSAPALAAH